MAGWDAGGQGILAAKQQRVVRAKIQTRYVATILTEAILKLKVISENYLDLPFCLDYIHRYTFRVCLELKVVFCGIFMK